MVSDQTWVQKRIAQLIPLMKGDAAGAVAASRKRRASRAQRRGGGVEAQIAEQFSTISPTTEHNTSSKTCYCGKDLKSFKTATSSFVCDVCNEVQPRGSTMRGCRECDWDMCARCDRGGDGASAGGAADDTKSGR